MASIKDAEITIEVNAELERICIESKEIIEGFHKLLGVHTSSEALAKIAVLMREDDTADRLLSKALGHLHSCPEPGSNDLYQEIASAFGESGRTQRAADCCPQCGSNNWRDAINPDTLEICNVCGNSR